MKFEWDPVKAATNEGKHRITFVTKPVQCLAMRFLQAVMIWRIPQAKIVSSHLVCQVIGVYASSAHALQLEKKNESMKKPSVKKTTKCGLTIRGLTWGPFVRRKYAARYAKATNVVVIDPALTKAFPNNEAVNEALRGLLAVATASVGKTTRSSRVGRNQVAV